MKIYALKQILIKWLMGILFAWIFNGPVLAQLSPGDLSKVHTLLEGLSNCTSCHEVGHKVTNQKCLTCHTEIQSRIDQQKGFHVSTLVKGKDCFACHSEHHGVNFQIIRFATDTFRHELTGYLLQGAHQKQACSSCHKRTFVKDEKLQKKSSTYLGLETSCQACHQDFHQQTLGTECLSCHDYNAFRPAPGFNHQTTAYPLQGKHQQVACQKCHKITVQNKVKFQQFKGVNADQCTQCHTDVHQNKFGPVCTDCHTYDSFESAGSVKTFDHNKTGFVLEGRHQEVSCKKCHKKKYTDPLPHKQCADCHTDYHKQQFVKQGKSPDCSECHNVAGFSPAAFTIEQHSKSRFSLTGAHLATPCFACHKKQERWEFRNIGQQCVDCHTDIHQPLIDEKYYPERACTSCHSTQAWNLVKFDHAKTKFQLEGAHQTLNCRLCHFNKETRGHVNQKFSGTAMACYQCHTDNHNGQFVENEITHCDQCHTTDKFIPASKFNHNTSRFMLDGKHANLACNACHKEVTENERTFVLYKNGKISCEDCHR